MGHHQQSIQAFRQVALMKPESSEAHVNLGIALADHYDLQGALREFSEAARLDPKSAIANFNEGRVLYNRTTGRKPAPCWRPPCGWSPIIPPPQRSSL